MSILLLTIRRNAWLLFLTINLTSQISPLSTVILAMLVPWNPILVTQTFFSQTVATLLTLVPRGREGSLVAMMNTPLYWEDVILPAIILSLQK